MFSELMPVLQNTTVTLTIARIDDQFLRVNVIPTRRKDRDNEAEKALATPLTVTATATELDQEFARQVLSFSSSYQRSAANISEIEAAHAAAVRAAEEERKNGKTKKATPQLARPATSTTTDNKGEPGGKPVFGSKGQPLAPPTTQSLFDAPPEDTRSPAEQGKNSSGEAVPSAETRAETTAVIVSEPARSSPETAPLVQDQDEPPRASEPAQTDLCGICKCPILMSQQRHTLMPFPAHASASDCEAARRAADA